MYIYCTYTVHIHTSSRKERDIPTRKLSFPSFGQKIVAEIVAGRSLIFLFTMECPGKSNAICTHNIIVVMENVIGLKSFVDL